MRSMVEAAAEASEEMMNKYLEEGDLSEADIKAGLRSAHHRQRNCADVCGSAFKNKGVQAMLDAVIEFMPAPTDIPPVKGESGRRDRLASASRRMTNRSRRWPSRS